VWTTKSRTKKLIPQDPLDVHSYFSKPSFPGKPEPDRKYNKTKQRVGDQTIKWLPLINFIDASGSLMP
jgi:hypothetical protein